MARTSGAVIVSLALLGACADDQVAAPSERPSDGPRTTPQDERGPAPTRPQGRDPLTWPYPAESIWNHPRGDDAELVRFPVSVEDLTVQAEEDLLIIEPTADPVDVRRTTAGWDPAQTRCGSATDDVLVSQLPIPEGWTTEDDYTGRTPNHSAAVVLADYTLFETQPLHVCEDGTVVSQYASPHWRGNSIVTGGVPGDVGAGSHGGSFMTAFGGTIRLGEWVRGGQIRHALKITVHGDFLSATEGGHRWPATRADNDFSTTYLGAVPEARMGALVSLPTDFDVDSLATEPARILARALIEHGAYVVDDAGMDTVGWAVEWGPQGRVVDEFEAEWGFPLVGRTGEADGAQQDFLSDLERVYADFHVVADNSVDTVGGAGEPLAPFAPPLATDLDTDIDTERGAA